MNFNSRTLFFVIVTLIQTWRDVASYCDYSFYDKRFDQLDEKLDKLYEKIDIMFNLTERVDEGFKVVSGVHKGGHTQNKDTTSQHALPVTIQEVRREAVEPDKVRYVVRYQKNEEQIIRSSVIPSNRHIQPDVEKIVGKSEEVSVTFKKELENTYYLQYSDAVTFFFYDQAMTTELSINLGNGPYNGYGGNGGEELNDTVVPIEGNFHLPQLDVVPPRELVYEEGQDIKVKVVVQKDVRPQYYYSANELHSRPYLYDLDKNEFQSSLYGFSLFQDSSGQRDFNVTLKTSEQRLCGILDFTKTIAIHYQILRSMRVRKMLHLRPSTQTRLFPQNAPFFYGDLNYMYFMDYQNDTDYRICNSEFDLCSADCLAIGGNIFDVMVQKVLPDGTMQAVRKIKRWDASYPYIKPADFEFSPPILSDTAEYEDQNFVCTAVTFDGATVTRNILVKTIMVVKILEEDSLFEVTKNETHLTIHLVCSARGVPNPEINFSSYINGYNLLPRHEPDETSVSGNGTVLKATQTSTIELSSDDEEVTIRPTCNAESMTSRDYHTFQEQVY